MRDACLPPRKQIARVPSFRASGALRSANGAVVKTEMPAKQPVPPLQQAVVDTTVLEKVKRLGSVCLGSTIGRGASGIVRLAKDAQGNTIAVKLMTQTTDSRTRLYHVREAFITSTLSHPNIIKLRHALFTQDLVAMSFDALDGVDLVTYLHTQGGSGLSPLESRFIFRQLVSAVQHLHRNGIVHRDLKGQNIHYNAHTGLATLLDFGLASLYTQERVQVEQQTFARLLLATNCGSPCYAPPEIYDGEAYHGPEVDVWSLGVVLYSLLTGGMPFTGASFPQLAASVRARAVAYPSHVRGDGELMQVFDGVFRPRRQRLSLSGLCYARWVNRGYRTPPIDFLELVVGRRRRAPGNPVAGAVEDGDDPPGLGERVHPLLHLVGGKKARKRVHKERLVPVDLSQEDEDRVLQVMVDKLKGEHQWPE
ncbi:MAG: hypothetical protein SGCHY_004882 [Lobulomycetales sp.]